MMMIMMCAFRKHLFQLSEKVSTKDARNTVESYSRRDDLHTDCTRHSTISLVCDFVTKEQ